MIDQPHTLRFLCAMKTILPIVLGLATTLCGAPVSADSHASETPAQRDARMAWWREARFGMFIHWGVYSVPAGTYKGKQVDGIGEWIMIRGKIPVAEYRAYAKEFNPVKYDADEWVRIGQGRRHEVHRHHLQAPRRLRHVRLEGQPTGTSSTPRPYGKRPAQGAGRGLPQARASSSASTTRRPRTGTTPAAPA